MRNPYSVLGINKTATAEEVKAAYRKVARKYHPDHNQGDAFSVQKFRDVTQAYHLLNDKTKRHQFDQGKIDSEGRKTPPTAGPRQTTPPNSTRQRPKHTATRQHPTPETPPNTSPETPKKEKSGIFSDLFGGRRKKNHKESDQKSDQAPHYQCRLNIIEAAGGTRKRITTTVGKTLELNIPAGTQDGQILRLRGQGTRGRGDALVELRVEPHALIRREGIDIHMDLPLSLYEATEGTSATVQTVTGKVKIKIPPKSNTGTILRLKGKGLKADKDDSASRARGDHYIRVLVTLPEGRNIELEKFLRTWKTRYPYNPRAKLDFFDD